MKYILTQKELDALQSRHNLINIYYKEMQRLTGISNAGEMKDYVKRVIAKHKEEDRKKYYNG